MKRISCAVVLTLLGACSCVAYCQEEVPQQPERVGERVDETQPGRARVAAENPPGEQENQNRVTGETADGGSATRATSPALPPPTVDLTSETVQVLKISDDATKNRPRPHPSEMEFRSSERALHRAEKLERSTSDNLVLEQSDLRAQWTMAAAAVVVCAIAFVQLGFSAWGIYLLVRTLKTNEALREDAARSTKAAEESAQAALKSANASTLILNSERSYLTFEDTETSATSGILTWHISWKNTGRTPAIIRKNESEHFAVPRSASKPDFGSSATATTDMIERILGPDQVFKAASGHLSTGEVYAAAFADSTNHFYVRNRIWYSDVIAPESIRMEEVILLLDTDPAPIDRQTWKSLASQSKFSVFTFRITRYITTDDIRPINSALRPRN